MKLKLVAVIVLVVVGGGAVAAALGLIPGNAAAGTVYLTAAASVADVTDDVVATGSIASTGTWSLSFGAAASRAIAAMGSGSGATTWPVLAVDTAVGVTVKQGDVLATAGTAALEVEIATATNELRIADIQLAIAKETREDASGTDEVRQANINLYSATNRHASSLAIRNDLRAQLAFATLVAPVDGVVTAVNIVEGADAPSGVAMTIAEATLKVTTQVVESDLASIALGQAATVTVGAVGAEAIGIVVAIAPVAGTTASGSVATFDVTVALSDAPAGVRIGMSADVSITIAAATDVLTVPSAALAGSIGNYRVRVLAATGEPETRTVTVGLVTEGAAEITDGLTAGELVITGTLADALGTTNGNGDGALGGGGAFPGGGGGFPGGGGAFPRGGGQ